MRPFRILSNRGPGFKFLAVFSVIALSLVINATGASAFTTPTAVLTGLSQPAETVTSTNGDVYFTQLVAPNTVTISRFTPGKRTPIEVYRQVGSGPYLNDIHFDKAGNLNFIVSVANPDFSSRRWALTRLNPSTGVATELVVTSGIVDPSAGYVGSVTPLLQGMEIDFVGIDDAGDIYFVEHSFDSGNQVTDLLVLKAGTSTPHPIGHFDNFIDSLTVAKNGDAYFHLREDGGIYQYQMATGSSRMFIANGIWHPTHVGLDAAGNLYAIERTLVGPSGFGQATSTIVRIVRFRARDLPSPSPMPVVISETTYVGFICLWAGSSSFFRVTPAGEVYWVQSLVDPTMAFTANQVIGMARGGGVQTSLFEEFASQFPSSSWNSSAAAQGPIGVAAGSGAVYAASTSAGELLQIRR